MTESEESNLELEIDRLVDGDLTDTERSQVLSKLDAYPGVWRQCALAFLEAQSWRESLRALTDSLPPAAPRASTPARARSAANPGLFWIGFAGIFVVAFSLGFGLGLRTLEETGAPRDPLAQDSAASEEETPGPGEQPVRGPGVPPAPAGADGPIEWVGVIEDPEMQQVVPIVSGPGLDEEWLRRRPAPLSDYARQQLERHGYRVEQGRRLFSIRMRDGERVTIPIDLVSVQYVGQWIY